HEVAGRVRHVLDDRVGHDLADVVGLGVAVLAPDVMAAADGAAFLPRHPDLLADPVARALHLLLHDRAGAVVRLARAGVVGPAAGQAAALGHDRAGAVVALRLPLDRAHGLLPFGPD